MSTILALDIGKRKTGVALGDDTEQFVMALDTIQHSSDSQLLNAILVIIHKRHIQRLVLGLPFLPDGSEGEQAMFVRSIAEKLQEKTSLPLEFIDERYTSFVNNDHRGSDNDAASACAILSIALDRQ